ncbi:MAG: RNA 2',3'-cyclic phosphodiesterase [Ignavibacterium sp.]|jgi:2'-5' RNA ligase|nr:RNA 2',3'-cyclic phosphodiesterase [Ignavibacterium sp.]
MNRLFISLNIPNNVIDKLTELKNLCSDEKELKWEPKEKLHLTLRFIGNVDQEKTTELIDRLKIISDCSAIKCSLEKFDFFFRDSVPSILWAGLKIDETIIKVIRQIDGVLENLSISFDKKKFMPHITLIRFRKDPGINFVNTFKNFSFEPIVFQANSITLFNSVLKPKGSVYYEMKKYFLK